jgi:hypothetical protein
VALVGEGVAAGVAQHARVRPELQAGGSRPPPDAGLSDGVCSQAQRAEAINWAMP